MPGMPVAPLGFVPSLLELACASVFGSSLPQKYETFSRWCCSSSFSFLFVSLMFSCYACIYFCAPLFVFVSLTLFLLQTLSIISCTDGATFLAVIQAGRSAAA